MTQQAYEGSYYSPLVMVWRALSESKIIGHQFIEDDKVKTQAYKRRIRFYIFP